ncbi:MAG TPA: hypothetical protein HPP58_07890, partial [Deltaproteobacteria bacterium]|nr:hypothetical protein [Deltaproteobacteria bacterium]
MKMNLENPLSLENVCESLLKKGLISMVQKEEIVLDKTALRKKADRTRRLSGLSKSGSFNPVIIIDQIAALKIARWDDPEKILDEDTIYQALAE